MFNFNLVFRHQTLKTMASVAVGFSIIDSSQEEDLPQNSGITADPRGEKMFFFLQKICIFAER
jgi:hypothetical protein